MAFLAEEIRRSQPAGDPDTGEIYYHQWLAALERVVVAKCPSTSRVLTRYRDAWEAVAKRTPHGKPTALAPKDFRPNGQSAPVRS